MPFTALTKYPNYGVARVSPPTPFPSTPIEASATWSSDLMPAGFSGVVAAATSNHAATLKLQRYADLAGLIPVGAELSQAMTADVPAWVGINDGLPYVSFAVSIVNSGGGTATITNATILTGPPI
jgi:hypothetical protein